MEVTATGTVLSRLSVAQWAISGAALLLLVVVLVLNCCYKNRRWRAVQEARSGLICADFLALRDLSKHAYEIIGKEAQRERSTIVKPAWRDGCGWGKPGTRFAGVHFKKFIGTSLHILQSHALRRDPTLYACPASGGERGSSGARSGMEDKTEDELCVGDFAVSRLACDVEEYLGRLRTALNGELDVDLCKQYLAFYRNARTPGRQCSYQEFNAFLGVFQEMLRRIER